MLRKNLPSLILLAAGIVIGLVLVELIVRMFFPNMTRASIVLRLLNERPTWARPDAQFHHVGDGIYRLSFPDGAEPGLRRVMIVGDSFAMGHVVGEENRFGRLLQQHLGPGTKVDVLATTSYSPVIYRNVVRKAFSAASYSAVAVFVDQTDLADDLIYDEDVIEDGSSQSFDLDRMTDREKIFDRAYSDLLSRFSGTSNVRISAAVNLLLPISLRDYFKPQDKYYRYANLSLHRPDLIGEFNDDPDSSDSRKMRSLISQHLDQIVAQCRERQVLLFLVANPWEFQSSRWPRVTLRLPGPFPRDNRLESFLASRFGNMSGVHVIPLTRFFREQDDPSSLFLAMPGHEVHWNAKGHVLVESVLRQYLLAALPDLMPRE